MVGGRHTPAPSHVRADDNVDPVQLGPPHAVPAA